MRQAQFTMYLYSNLLPITELTLYHCLKCMRPLFKASSNTLVISNGSGSSFESFPPGSQYIEYKCHSCNAMYNVLFQ